MKRLVLAALVSLLCACGSTSSRSPDAGTSVDRATDLPRAPAGSLPADLFPPGER